MPFLTFLPFVVWYVLPGLNFIVFCMFAPMIILHYHGTIDGLSAGQFVAIGVGSLVVGFIMDSLKLYRATPKYKQQRTDFFTKLGNALGIRGTEEIRRVFDIIQAEARKSDQSRMVELEHSRWVMINHTSKCFFLTALIWACVAISHWVVAEPVKYLGFFTAGGPLQQLGVDFSLLAVNFLLGLRLQRVSFKEAATSDMNYLIFVRRNAPRLRAEITDHLGELGPG